MSSHQLIQHFKRLIPKLTHELHKGQNGRITIVGGSKEYTGAPYFSTISALRTGADMAFVLTSKDAAPVIKSYDPDFIVLPILDSDNNKEDIETWLKKSHAMVIGPGLGKSDYAMKSAKTAILLAKEINIPIVIDADALLVVNNEPALVKGYKKCLLTPNSIEFKRLYEALLKESYEEPGDLQNQCSAVKRLSASLENVTILKKGKFDIISDGTSVVYNESEGSPKRCGGQGDLLSGVLGTFMAWASMNNQGDSSQNFLAAAYSGCFFIKECSKKAFETRKRSLLAQDMIGELGTMFEKIFD